MKPKQNKQGGKPEENQMALEVIESENQELAIPNNINNSVLESWNMIRKALAEAPTKEEIQVNSFANDSKFLPIGVIESKLDLIYSGLWQTDDFHYQVVVNEIVGSIKLKVFIAGAGWITRIGTGAVMIQQTSKSAITDINAKIKNTLQKDMPHLKSECIKNASKSLGVSFGRSLNRDVNGSLTVYYSDSSILEEAKKSVMDKLDYDNYQTEGKNIFKTFELQMNDVEKKNLQNFITKRKTEIKLELERIQESKKQGATA
jgi:hypothetical protein